MQRFRPMGLGDIFDEAFDLYKKNFLYLLLVTAVVAVPAQVVAPVLALHFPSDVSLAHLIGDALGDLAPTQFLLQLGPVFSGPAYFAPLYPLATALEIVALTGACSACYLGEGRPFWPIYHRTLRRLLPLAATLLLYALFMLLGLAACYFFVLFPLTWLALTAHTFAIEGKNFVRATGRSYQVVAGYGMRVFGCLVLLYLVAAIVGLGIQLPLVYAFDTALNITPGSDLLFGGGSAVTALSEQRRIITQVSQGLANLVLTPFAFSVLTVLYYDLRVRKEAFDIELLARGLRYPPLSALGGYLPPSAPPLPAPARPGAPPPAVQGGAPR